MLCRIPHVIRYLGKVKEIVGISSRMLMQRQGRQLPSAGKLIAHSTPEAKRPLLVTWDEMILNVAAANKHAFLARIAFISYRAAGEWDQRLGGATACVGVCMMQCVQ